MEDIENWEKSLRGLTTKDKAKKAEDVVLEIERGFILLCSLMEEKGSKDPKDYTVIQYYGKLDYINNQVKKME